MTTRRGGELTRWRACCRLGGAGIVVGPEGYIRKCMDEDFDGILVRP